VPYLKLVDTARQRPYELRDAVVRLGRDPACSIAFTGDDATGVSARHAELRWTGGAWRVADLESRNGTYLNGRRLTTEEPVAAGDVIGLGERGPKVTVAATAETLAATVPEHPAIAVPSAAPARPAEARAYSVMLLAAGTGKRYEARGVRIRIGRGRECEVQAAASDDSTVSRVHAELTVGASGGLVLRDAGSKNGTLVNGELLRAPVPVRLGDKIQLGKEGPALIVEGMGTAPVPAQPRPQAGLGQRTVMGMIGAALSKARDERKRGGRGSTAFFKAVAEEVGRDSRRKIRWLTAAVVILVLVLAGGAYGGYLLLSSQVAANQLTLADSVRADAERLRHELADARAQAAPAALVDSLRTQLDSANSRTATLQAALVRAQQAVGRQLAAGDTQRLAAQAGVQRLRDELAAAERRAPSAAMIDSLRHAVSTAEAQTATLDARLRAIRGTDFATIAQQNQGAVGLITAQFGRDYYDGSGFAITADGYMLTNWHVVSDSGHPRADTLWVTMADQALGHYADVIATSQTRDVALIKLRGYQGPYITTIDWSGTKARQGEPAGLIGFPAGSGFARLRSGVVRTSMTAGIISRVTEDVIQFDGMTIGGSSGSPVFNANGEVISIHRAGLKEAPGFALSVPIKHAIVLFPQDLRDRLGIK
jgi:pSer/pThr/pTyr-binding forkhead associated (FHA) protein/S1-C subfamily serine protease